MACFTHTRYRKDSARQPELLIDAHGKTYYKAPSKRKYDEARKKRQEWTIHPSQGSGPASGYDSN